MPSPSPHAELLARTPVTHTTRALAGTTTHLWTYGPDDAERTLLFLHGFRGDHHGLEPIVAHLHALVPELRIVVPDLPGFGASTPFPRGRHDVAQYASWARELIAGDVVLAGHSFGSIVAAATVADGAPVDRLVLVNPIAAAALAGPRVFLTRLTAAFHRLTGWLPERLGTALLRHRLLTAIASGAMLTTPDRALRRWIHEEHGRYFATFANRASLLEAFTASVTHDVSQYAAELKVPTLLVAADRDDLVPPATQTALLRRLPDAELVVLPGTGHLAHYEAPAAVAERIAAFL